VEARSGHRTWNKMLTMIGAHKLLPPVRSGVNQHKYRLQMNLDAPEDHNQVMGGGRGNNVHP